MLRRQLEGFSSALTFALISVALTASPAAATTMYTDVLTGGFFYDAIQETSTFGDPEPLFDQPSGSGGSLFFSPPAFIAQASGGGGFDQTGSQLQLQLSFSAVPDTPILSLELQEFGDILLLGTGTPATGTFAGMSGSVTILDTISGNNLGYVINFVGTVTPSLTELPTDLGVTLWEGNAFIDIAAEVSDATLVMLSFDNDLTAFSEDGTSAKIQKKISNGLVIIPTPEPNTLMLIGGGLVVALLGTRERRGSLS